MTKLINVKEFIEQVWEVEGLRIKLSLSDDHLVPPYAFSEPMSGDFTIEEFLDTRIRPHIVKAISN